MDRDEFIRQLRIALSGNVNYNMIEDNVRYYEDYIDTEIRKGKPEGQVLEELGNPRLIAKTIIETNKIAGTTEDAYREEETYDSYQEDENPGRSGFFGNFGDNRTFRLPLWLVGIGIFLVILLFFTLLTTVMAALLPYLFPIILVIAAARLIRTLWR